MKPLQGRIAVVAGATRGAGRGIACMLGEAGALVYCTGRSVRGRPATPGRSETLEETAERVDQLGGIGIALRVDHTVEDEVKALFERVRTDHGRLDVLVNDIWGGDALTEWGRPLWQLDLAKGRQILESACWSHIVTARHGLPLMVERNSGLVVEITDGDFQGYRGALFYDLAKAVAIRLAYAYSVELRRHPGVTAVAVTPGFLRSESMLEGFGVSEANWQEQGKKDPHFLHSEMPAFVGRAVAALAADPNVHEKSGRVFGSWTLAREYGFDDVDGRRPDWGRHIDGVITEILARGGPRDDEERFLLEVRYYQLHLDPTRAEETARVQRAPRRVLNEGGAMRRVRYSVAMSLDGYVAGPKGEYDWIVMDPEIDFAALTSSFDAMVMGRKTYEAAQKMGGGPSMGAMQVYVLSRTLKPSDCKGVTLSDDAKATVKQLKAAQGKDIWLFGGGELFRSLLEMGLVDSVEVGVIPVLLGGGIPLLPDPAKRTKLKLAKHKVYAKTGTVGLEYTVAR